MAGFSFNFGGGSIGSGASGAAGHGCGGGCGAVLGMILGLVMVPAGFYLAYYSEAKLVDHGHAFEAVTMVEPSEAADRDGQLVNISGQPEGEFLTIPEWDGEALFWRRTIEQYEREEDTDGEVSYDWNTESSDEGWAEFSIGEVRVIPDVANPVGEKEVYSAYKKQFETDFHVGTSRDDPEVGDRRKTVEVLNAADRVIVLGEMSCGTIRGGSSFVVSTLSETETASTLKSEYRVTYWLMKAGSVLLIFLGLTSIFIPLTTLFGHVPLIGEQLSCGFALLALVFALVSVAAVTFFVKAFWFLVIAVVLVIAFLIYRGATTPRQRAGAETGTAAVPAPASTVASAPRPEPRVSDTAEPGAAAGVPRPVDRPLDRPEDVHQTLPPETPVEREATRARQCVSCGATLEADDRFCRQCGEPVSDDS